MQRWAKLRCIVSNCEYMPINPIVNDTFTMGFIISFVSGLEPIQMQHAGGVLLAVGCNFPGDNAPCFSLPDRFSLAGAYIVGKKLHFFITAAPAVPKSDAYSFFQMLFFLHRKPSKEHSSPCIDFLGHQNDGYRIHGQ